MYEATKLGGMELSLANLIKFAPFYSGLSREVKQALHVYEVLKFKCRSDGHTYVFESGLRSSYKSLLKNCKTYYYFTLPIDDERIDFFKSVKIIWR